jgi:DNA-binding LytR/AlgR family response regulator
MENAEPDLIFADIQLNDGVSFEIFERYQFKCPVIFTTAYDEYAIRAFKVNGIDYLLKPVDDEELMMTRNSMIGSILGDLDGPFQVIGRWKNIILNNVDEGYFARSVQIIKTITADELHELANKYLQPEAFYELVVI